MCYKSLLNFLRGNDNIKKFFFVCCFIFLLIGFIFALIMYSKIVLGDESESLKVSHDSLLKNWREEGHQDDEDEIKIMRNDTNNNNNNWDSEIENITSHLSLSSTGEGDPNKNEKNYLFKARNIWSDSKTIAPEAIGGLSRRRRNKRSVIHLFNMVLCATGCNPLAFKGYGCFCGFLGSGYPVDGIDRCCWLHDQCYDATGCPTFLEYFVPYYWKCYRGSRPICAITHGSWGGPGSCSQRLCECDRALSQCLRKYPCPESKAVCTSAPFRLIQNIFMML